MESTQPIGLSQDNAWALEVVRAEIRQLRDDVMGELSPETPLFSSAQNSDGAGLALDSLDLLDLLLKLEEEHQVDLIDDFDAVGASDTVGASDSLTIGWLAELLQSAVASRNVGIS